MTPALSETTVALSFRVGRTEDSQRRFVTDLVLLDRASGALRDRRTLMPELDQDDVDLVAFGDALYVCGSGSMEILR